MKDNKAAKPAEENAHNPLDGYERFLKSRKTRFKRVDADTLVMEVETQTLEMFWNEEDEALHFLCSFGEKLPESVRDLASPVILHINRRQWLGHFEITEDGFPCFRYTMLFHGTTSGAADTEVIEELADIITRSCQQFMPAFSIMASATGAADFPRIMGQDGQCEKLGLALLDTGGRG